MKQGISSSIGELQQTGTGLVGDVSNSGSSLSILRKSPLHGRVFLEAIGFNTQKEQVNRKEIKAILGQNTNQPENITLSVGAHTPYTVSSNYLRYLFSLMPPENDFPFTIHVAEPREELSFFLSGCSQIKDLLIERGGWNFEWVPPGVSSIEYLAQLGVLSSRTICVQHQNVC